MENKNWIYELGYSIEDRYETKRKNGKLVQHKIGAVSDIEYFTNEEDAIRHHLANPRKYFIRYINLNVKKPNTTAIERELEKLDEKIEDAKIYGNFDTINALTKAKAKKLEEFLNIVNQRTRIIEEYDDKYKMFKPLRSKINRIANEETGEVTIDFVHEQLSAKKIKS